MPLINCSILLLLSVLTLCLDKVWATSKHCHQSANRNKSIDENYNEVDFLRHGARRKVELPEDCGRFHGLFSGQPLLRTLNYPRIRHGYEAKHGQFPSYVELKISDNRASFQSFCGGTILTTRHILTAAHCVYKYRAEQTKVGSGIKGYRKNGVKDFEINAERFCKSSKFDFEGEITDGTKPLSIYDIAIIKLQKDIKFSSSVQPACLPRRGHPLGNHQQTFSIGLGFTYLNPLTGKSQYPATLQVQPNTKVECQNTDRHHSIICHKPNYPDYLGFICGGDSGGPFMGLNLDERQTVYGVHSYATVACMELPPPDPSKYKGQVKDRYIAMSANVHDLLDEIDKLLEECA